MRLALMNKLFSPTAGGGERYSWSLAGRLAALGHEVHAFCGGYEEPQPGITVHKLCVPRFPRCRRITGFASHAEAALRTPGLPAFDATYALAPVYGADVFYMGGGSYRHWLRINRPNPLWRWFNAFINPSSLAQIHAEKRMIRESGKIVAISGLVRQHALELGADPTRVEVIHTGYFENEFSLADRERLRAQARASAGIDSDQPLGIFLGNFWPRKGLDAVIRALPEAVRQAGGLKILVAGKGDVPRYERLAHECGVREQVIFRGPTRCPAELFCAGDFFIFPGLYDPGGAVILEAMACGTPVIASALCGNAEVIRDGVTGYVLPDPHDTQLLALRMAELAANPARARQMGVAAAEEVPAYSFDRIVQRLLALFADVAQRKRG